MMNSGSFALEPISQDQVLVTVALALVAILAVLTVIAMVWGARLKRRRNEAEAEEQRRIEELEAAGVEVTNAAEGSTPVTRTTSGQGEAASTQPAAPPTAPAEPATERPVPIEAEAQPRPLADEPIAAAAPFDASPASVAADAPVTTASDDPGAQPVTMLKGLGPKIATRLSELGITRVDQLAWLDDAEAAELDRQLGAFEGRMERDRWREQARLLAQGDRPGYEAQFGRLG